MTCSSCKHHAPTTIYPLLWCNFSKAYTPKHETCVKWCNNKKDDPCK